MNEINQDDILSSSPAVADDVATENTTSNVTVDPTQVLFSTFNLAEPLALAIEGLGYPAATKVQAEAFAPASEGKDLLVSSKTGSGKTVAFLLPSLQRLLDNGVDERPAYGKLPQPKILVLCPTRELAQQVAQDAINLVRHIRGMRIATVMGGMPFVKQIQGLKGADVLIATPGRLLDLITRRQLNLEALQTLVLDEADRMLDLGFQEDLERINELASTRDQTLMFSATFAPRIMSLAESMTQNAVRITIESGQSTNSDINQTMHWADGFEHKKKLLNHWLSIPEMDQAVVFANTQIDTESLADELIEMGHKAIALHGAMPQAVRIRRLKSLRSGQARILVATDVAARGLDIPTISHVINFGLPMKNEDYVHRIGRTGRAGRSGQAITLVLHKERRKVRDLEHFLNATIAPSVIEGLEPQLEFTASRGKPSSNRSRSNDNRSGFKSRSSFGDRNERGGDRERFAGGNADRAPRFDRGGDRPARAEGGFNRERPAYAGRDGNSANGNYAGGFDRAASPRSDRPAYDRAASPRSDRPAYDRAASPRSDRPAYDRSAPSSRPAFGAGSGARFDNNGGEMRRSFADSQNDFKGSRPRSEGGFNRPRPDGDRPSFGNRDRSDRPARAEGGFNRDSRPSFGNRDGGGFAGRGADTPRFAQPAGGAAKRPWIPDAEWKERQGGRSDRQTTDSAPRKRREF